MEDTHESRQFRYQQWRHMLKDSSVYVEDIKQYKPPRVVGLLKTLQMVYEECLSQDKRNLGQTHERFSHNFIRRDKRCFPKNPVFMQYVCNYASSPKAQLRCFRCGTTHCAG